MFNLPQTMEGIKERIKVVRALHAQQAAISAEALRRFSDENMKEAALAAEEAFLRSIISQSEDRLV